jgi:hypothetical protein
VDHSNNSDEHKKTECAKLRTGTNLGQPAGTLSKDTMTGWLNYNVTL